MARPVVTADRPGQPDWTVDAVVVRSAPDRLDIGLLVAAGGALLAPAISLALGVSPVWLPGANTLWRAAHLSAFDGLGVGPFTGALATQALVFIAVLLVWRAVAQFGPQHGWLLPDARADAQARDLFDTSRPTVLVYVARTQRAVRILVPPDLANWIAPATIDEARLALVEHLRRGDEAAAIGRARSLLAPRA